MLPPPHLDDLSLTFAIPESGASPFSTSVVGNNRSTQLDLQQHMSVLDVPIRLTTGLGKCCGRFMDTYHGEPLVDQNTLDIYQIPKHIAVKLFRTDPKDGSVEKKVVLALVANKAFQRLLIHPNISPTWILKSSAESIAAFAMPWFDHGNVLDYIHRNPTVNKLAIVKQIVNAIAYLHAMDIVHGNIVPTNIMITNDGRPCISDVGMHSGFSKAIFSEAWHVPWSWTFKPPEELSFDCGPSAFAPTKAMDVYSFANTVYTIFTSNPPFPAKPEGRGITKIVASGHVLERPTVITISLWHILQRCWSYNPEDRPSITDVELALMII